MFQKTLRQRTLRGVLKTTPGSKDTLYHRDKVKSLLMKKYRTKYGTTRNEELDIALQRELEEVMGMKSLNVSHLQRIDRRMQSLTKSLNDGSVLHKAKLQMAVAPEAHINKLEANQNSSLNRANTILPPITKTSSEDYWEKLIELDLKKFQEEVQNNAKKNNDKKKQVREDLMRQMMEKQKLKHLERIKNEEYENKMMMLTKMQEEEEKKREAHRIEKIREEKLLRIQQIKDEFNAKKQLKSENLANEKKELQEIYQKMEQEALELKQKRDQKILEFQQVKEENSKNKEYRDMMHSFELEQDKKILEESIKAQEMQAKKRTEEFKSKEERILAIAKYAESNVRQHELDKRKQEEVRFIKNLMEREKKEEEEEAKRKQAQLDREKIAKRFLDCQVREKEQMRKERAAQGRELARSFALENEEYQKDKLKNSLVTREKYKVWHKEIMEQIHQHRAQKHDRGRMNEREISLNKTLIDEAIHITPPRNVSPNA